MPAQIEPTYFLTRTMRCPKQPLAGEFQQTRYPQHLGTPGFLWPPCPPQPVYNPWIRPPQYPTAGSMPPYYSQLLPQDSGSGERSLLFQALVEAVSKEIKNDEKKATAVDGCKTAASADLSVQDQKALINTLKKQKDRELAMQQVFEELSQKYGYPEIVWQTWFFANYEKLNHNPNVGGASTGETGSNASSSQVSSRTRSASHNHPLRSPNTAATNERTRSRNEEPEWEDLTSDDQGSTHGDSGSSAPRDADAPQPHTTAPSHPARARRTPAKVTDTDLRAMAHYRFEKGEDEEIRRYSYPRGRWREFAERPEVSTQYSPYKSQAIAGGLDLRPAGPKPRRRDHAINQFVRQFQLLAEGGDSKASLLSSLGGAGEQRLANKIITSQKETGDQEDGIDGPENKANPCADPEDIIDLTAEET